MTTKQGLTLGEVLFIGGLVVVAGGILAFVALHTHQSSQHRLCTSNVRQLGTAEVMYAMDHDDTVPPFGNIEKLSISGQRPNTGPQPSLLRSLLRIYSDDSTWFCPSDRVQGQHVVYLGIDHTISSYAFPRLAEQDGNPARMKNLPPSTGLVFDAAGDRASCESGTWFAGSSGAASNHPDGTVNFVVADLSLRRSPAVQPGGKILP